MGEFRLDNDKAAAELVARRGAEVEGALKRGRRNYLLAYALTLVSLAASVGAGVLGILSIVPATVVGVVALIPAAVTLALRTLKLQARANLNYELAADLDGILSRATWSGLESDNAGALAWEFAERSRRFTADWARLVGFDDQLPSGGAPPRASGDGSTR